MTKARNTRGLHRALSIGVQVALMASALFVLATVYQFSQTRFLSIDEFQWGHATWLIADGQIPYLDFYEHHLPLGYTLNALFYDADAGFAENTLQFRKIGFGYLLAALAALAWLRTTAGRCSVRARAARLWRSSSRFAVDAATKSSTAIMFRYRRCTEAADLRSESIIWGLLPP